jgi:hypothetical protein
MFQFMLHTIQAGMSGYALYNASIAIPRLQQYEDMSKTAAKYSSTAAHELHKTRTTQAAGAISGLISAGTSISLLFGLVSPGSKSMLFTALSGMSCAAATLYIGQFYENKSKIITMTDYNSAITSSKSIRGQLALLSLLWGVSLFFEILHVL